MFTGIIEGVGKVKSIRKKDEGAEIEISCGFDIAGTNVGDSISVSGCCLTVTSRLGISFWADVSPETLEASTLGSLVADDPVNIERALMVGGRLGGHIVQGHVDGVGFVTAIKSKSGSREFEIECPDDLSRYLVAKGSVAIDGVSLTVNRCEGMIFSVMVIPHTQLATTFQAMKVGDSVNLEVDIIGKYVEKLHFLDSDEYKKKSKITAEFLRRHGF